MYKITHAGSSGAMWTKNVQGAEFYFRPKVLEGRVDEMIPSDEVDGMMLQNGGNAIDMKFIEGIIGVRTNLTLEDVAKISQFIRALDNVKALRQLAKNTSSKVEVGDNEQGEEGYKESRPQEVFTELQDVLRDLVQELNPEFDVDKFLEIFQDIHKEIMATRRSLEASLVEEIKDGEIAYNAVLLNHESGGIRAFTVRMAAELALALKDHQNPEDRIAYYHELVRKLGIISEQNPETLDTF